MEALCGFTQYFLHFFHCGRDSGRYHRPWAVRVLFVLLFIRPVAPGRQLTVARPLPAHRDRTALSLCCTSDLLMPCSLGLKNRGLTNLIATRRNKLSMSSTRQMRATCVKSTTLKGSAEPKRGTLKRVVICCPGYGRLSASQINAAPILETLSIRPWKSVFSKSSAKQMGQS